MSFAERLRAARRMARMSQDQLAQRAGITKQAVSKYELGKAMPGSRVLLAMSRALDVSADFFLRPANLPKLQLVAYRRHRTRLSARDRNAIEEKAREQLERYIEAESLSPQGRPGGFELPDGWPRVVRSLEEVEDAAVHLRKAWNLGLDAIESVTDVLENRGVKVLPISAGEGFQGIMFREHSSGSPVIVVNENMPGDRQRLTLAHELGHLVLRPEGQEEEEIAWLFAGAFLMPRQSAVREMGTDRRELGQTELEVLKQKYGMSMQALFRRAWDLSIIRESTYQRMCRDFSRRGWRRREPGPGVQPERPRRMRQLVGAALAEGCISRARAAELLNEALNTLTGDAHHD